MENAVKSAVKTSLPLLPVLAATLPLALNCKLRLRRYTLATHKLAQPLRLALLSDLHGEAYGPGQRTLLQALARQNPDIVLLAGDIADNSLPNYNTWVTLRALAQRYPCYYVSGNHEVWSGRLPVFKKMMRSWGITVLEGRCATATVRGQRILICGDDDPSAGRQRFVASVARMSSRLPAGEFAVLLAHRPEYASYYARQNYDLVLAGHSHGGQWRLPGLIEGAYSSAQGILPRYAGGRFDVGKGTMIVGRGLSRYKSLPIPRIFNPPELVVVDLLPNAIQGDKG